MATAANMGAGFAPVSVGIPTYARGDRVCDVLARLQDAQPPPAEVVVHVDASDGRLEQVVRQRFPGVQVLSSRERIGPGGGRDRCLRAARTPYFASFDDDSWPVEKDFFARLVRHFERLPRAAVLAGRIFHRHEEPPRANQERRRVVEFTGCGHAVRVAAYPRIAGYVDRPVAYGLEERDVGLQWFADGWEIWECDDLVVFHDTELRHHADPRITQGTIENAALLPYLRYPVQLWPRGLLQYLSVLRFLLRAGRFRGLTAGVLHSPRVVWQHRRLRRPLPADRVRAYLAQRRRVSPAGGAKSA